uniref:Uncharacterized protein n=1 Tax=Arundo donax TaxID=35708 RepID=A0A0A9G9J8_ARUDO
MNSSRRCSGECGCTLISLLSNSRNLTWRRLS